MANSSTIFLSLSLLLLLVANPSSGVSDDVIKQVCESTQDVKYCIKALQSDPGTATADIPGLVEIAAKLASSSAVDCNSYAMALARNRTHPEVGLRYLQCSEHLVEADDEIQDAREELRAKKYMDVSKSSLDATEDAESCQDLIKKAPADPSKLPDKINQLVTLCAALFFAAQLLLN